MDDKATDQEQQNSLDHSGTGRNNDRHGRRSESSTKNENDRRVHYFKFRRIIEKVWNYNERRENYNKQDSVS